MLFDGYVFNHPSPEEEKKQQSKQGVKNITPKPIGKVEGEHPKITKYREFLSIDPTMTGQKLEARINAYKKKLEKEDRATNGS